MLDKSIPHIGVLMVKTDTSHYPRFELPEGFSFCGYRTGLEVEWADLMFEVDQTDTLEEAQDIFKKEFLSKPELLSKQCLFVLDGSGRVAACGSLWHGEHFGKELQRIHFIATRPEYQGKGLIKALMTKLLDTYNELGYKNFIYLTSQTWSYKAINIYSKFGFVPYTGEKPQNWWANNFKQNNERAWAMIIQKTSEYKAGFNNAFSIRKATIADAGNFAAILCESWKAAYKDILTSEQLAVHTNLERRTDTFKKMIPSGKEHFYLAFDGTKPCGLCSYGDSRDSDMNGFAEIIAFYTLEDYWGKGIGTRIMDFALSEISRLGYKNIMLWVFEDNVRARRFYEKCGFVCDGTTKGSGFAKVKEIRYRMVIERSTI